MVEIEFTKDFANKKKGDVITVDTMIASSLIKRKVAKKPTKKAKTKSKK